MNDQRLDARGERQRFTSSILPPYMRRSPKVVEVLPIRYLRGLPTGDLRPALQGVVGDKASGLSPTNIARLTTEWEKEYREHRTQSLAEKDYVYVWVSVLHAFEKRSQKTPTRDVELARTRCQELMAWRREHGYGR